MKINNSSNYLARNGDGITAERGTYALVLRCEQQQHGLTIGSLGSLGTQPGFYVYVGSAFGTGGLSARIRHHRKIAARPHWHIDYLRARCDLIEVWFSASPVHKEHSWAEAVARMRGARIPLQGFGSSDCDCRTHLFWFPHRPSANSLQRLTTTKVSVHR